MRAASQSGFLQEFGSGHCASSSILISLQAYLTYLYFRAIDFTNWSETGLASILFPSTTNGECAFVLKMAMRTTLR